MFLRKNERDISDEEFEEILLPHYKMVDDFMEGYVIPEVIAFYLASGYYGSCMRKVTGYTLIQLWQRHLIVK